MTRSLAATGAGLQDLEAIVRALPGLYLLLDRDLSVVAASETYLEVAGAHGEDVLGRGLSEAFPRDIGAGGSALEDLVASSRRVLQTKRCDTIRIGRCSIPCTDHVGATGAPVVAKQAKLVSSPVLDEWGEIKWIISSIEDISEAARVDRGQGRPLRLSEAGRAALNGLRVANGILKWMPENVFDLVADDFTPVALVEGTTVVEPYQPIKTIYFPLTGLYTTIRHLADGSSAEIVMADRTGFIGVSVLGPEAFEQTEVRVLVAGTALAVGAETLRAIMRANPIVRAHLERAIPMLMAHVSLSAACNARHSVQQRVALWLLKASDRVGSPQLGLIQEDIAMLLGSRRTGISETLSRFSAAGLVETARHRITIIDRPKLEGYACGCYLEAELSRAGHPAAECRMDSELQAHIGALLEAYDAVQAATAARPRFYSES